MGRGVSKISDNNRYNKSAINNIESFFGKKVINNVVVSDEHFADLLSGAIAYIDPNDASTLYIRDAKTVQDYIDAHSRSLHKNATINSVMAHEIAHAISTSVNESDILSKAISNFEKTSEYKTMLNSDPMNKFLPSWQLGAESISKMATTTKHELFAEALADVFQNKENAESLSKIIFDEYKNYRS